MKTQPVEGIPSLTLADGRTTSEPRLTTLSLKAKLADDNERLPFTVFPVARYDFIFGRPWLTKNNPHINYTTNQVNVESGNQSTARLATEQSRETPDVELNFITGKQALHSLRQGEEGFFAWVSSSGSPETTLSSTLTKLESKIMSFPIILKLDHLKAWIKLPDHLAQELPHSLPPERAINHDIDLVPGSSPPSRTPYRLPKPLMDECQSVEEWPIPESVTQVRSFLGFANYFRRFITHSADIAKPSDAITGKGARFSWNDERQKAFEDLKSAFICAPVLLLGDVSKPFRVLTDASETHIAGALMKEMEDTWHPVAIVSRKLSSAEQNYTIVEQETLAVVFALQCWRLHLFKHFDLFTDNQAVVYLHSKPNLRPREARWSEFLADFDFTVHHIPGKLNIADPLTRQLPTSSQLNSLEFK